MLAVTGAALVVLIALVQSAFAASTINVNTTADENGTGPDCSLREALTTANTNSNFGGCTGAAGGPFTISVPAGTYSLTAGELQVGTTSGANITISGASSASTIIRQSAATCSSGTARVFDLDPSLVGNVAVSISGVTISNGAAQAFGGGAILGGGTNDSLNLSNSVISGNCTTGFLSAAGISWSPDGNVTITNTTFSNNVSGQGAGAILYTTGTASGSGRTLTITNSTFTGNTAAASGSAGGALLLGQNGSSSPTFNINGSVFTNNQATNATGIGGAIYVGGGTLNLGNTAANRFAGNTAGVSTSGGLGVRGGTANATNNWWNCNAGPGVGASCDRADNSGGTLTFTPWIVLSNAASPTTIKVNQTSTLTADFLHNSSGGSLTTSQIAVLLGLPVSWGSAVRGTLSGSQTMIQSNGTATSTFTATAAGAGSATATVGNGVATANVTINKADTTTSISSDSPDPSFVGQAVTVKYAVSSPGAVAPTGNVTVSDGTASCTGTVAAGQCSISFTSAGGKGLTASYAGDANFNSSSSSPATAHAVYTADTISVGTTPTGVAVAASKAYVANQGSNTVSVIDLMQSPPVVVATIPVGGMPDAAALSADGSRLYVPNFLDGTLSIVATATNTVSHTVAVGSRPTGVAEVAGSVYVANLLSGTISVIDPVAGSVTGTISLPGAGTATGVAPSGLAASGDGHRLYANDARNGRTYVIDLTQSPPAVGGFAAVGLHPAYLSVAGSTGYVANPGSNSVSVLDLSQSAPVTSGSVTVGSSPYGVVAAPASKEVFVTNSGSNNLSVIDTTGAPTVAFTIATGKIPDAIALSPDQQAVVVSNEGDNTVSIFHVNQAPASAVPGADQNPTADRKPGARAAKVTSGVAQGTLGLVAGVRSATRAR